MPEDFEWHTSEEDTWNEPSPEVEKARRRSARSLLVLVVFSLAVGLTGLFIYRLIDQRTADATAAVEANILTTHQLIRQADQQDDLELFRFSLSSRDQAWSEAQEQFLIAGSLLDRPAFNLRPISDGVEGLDLESQEAKNVEVVLSPDLSSAEIQFDQAYLIGDGEQAGTTVNLRQTAVYRLGERWLLAPPQKEFWGKQESLAGEHLQVTYPERDREVIERLASDLDDLVSEACRKLADLACPETLQIQLHFEEEIGTLSAMGQVSSFLEGDLDLHLPAPTLVGWPLDEASYQVLRRGYGLTLLSALITDRVGYQCCQHGPFYQALLDAQLFELGLGSWPLTKPLQWQQDQLSGSTLRSLNDVGLFWFSNQFASPIEEIWPVYVLVDFLRHETNLSTADLQRYLVQGSDQGYWDWLQRITANLQMSEQDLERAWLGFNQVKFPIRQQMMPASPQQDLQLACRPNRGINASLYRYNFGADELTLEHQLGHAEAFMIGLPDDEGVIVAERRPASPVSGTRTLLWQDGQEAILVQSEDNLVPVSFIQLDESPVENLLILNRRQRQYSLLRFHDCPTTRNCSASALNGFPLWSPDGSSILILVSMGSYGYEGRFERPLSLGGVTGEIIGIGKEPFWLDDQTIAFISPQGREITTVDIGDFSQRSLLTVIDIIKAISPFLVSEMTHLAIEYAAINPIEPDSLLIVARGTNNTYFFSTTRQGKEIQLENFTEDILTPDFMTDLQFSPDGRWLVISTNDLTYHVATVSFYDTIARKALHYRFHGRYDLPMHWQMDWSADGQWLSIIDNGYIRMFAPEFDHQRLIVPDDMTCTAAAWIN